MSEAKILLRNAGSSSLKCTRIEAASRKVVVQQFADWAGPATRYRFIGPDGRERCKEVAWRGVAEGVQRVSHDLTHVEPVALSGAVHAGPESIKSCNRQASKKGTTNDNDDSCGAAPLRG